MNYLFRPFAAAILVLLLASCGERRRTAEVLTHVADMVELQPDSALRLLESITEPERLPKKLRMEYALRYVQAKDKAYHDVTNDTAVFAAADFFVREEDNEKAALALFYTARVRQEQQRVEEAAHSYHHAIDHAAGLEDKTLQGMAYYNLGGLSYDQLLTDKAIACYKKAYQCFCQKPDDYRRQVMALAAVGDSHSVNEQPDSALRYFKKGLVLAMQHADSALQSSICQSMGVALQEKGEAAKAHSYFLQAVRLGADDLGRVVLYRNLANSCLSLERHDSARYYMQLLLQLNMQDTTAIGRAVAYHLQSGMEEERGRYKKALEYHKLYASYQAKEYENILSSSLREVEEKYQLEQVENRHSQRVIWFQRTIIGALGLMLVALLVALRLYRRNLHLSERLRQMAGLTEQARAAAEEMERVGKEQTLTLEAKETMLNDLRQQRLDTLKRASLLKSWLTPTDRSKFENDMHQFDQLIYGSRQGSDWQLLYGSLNELYGGALDKLQELLPQLSDIEFRVCCLSYAQFDNTEASTVLSITGKTTLNLRSIIRKKLQMPNGADIYTFLRLLSRSESTIG
jgi:tetratricopeptide (TPR) repeat protein